MLTPNRNLRTDLGSMPVLRQQVLLDNVQAAGGDTAVRLRRWRVRHPQSGQGLRVGARNQPQRPHMLVAEVVWWKRGVRVRAFSQNVPLRRLPVSS